MPKNGNITSLEFPITFIVETDPIISKVMLSTKDQETSPQNTNILKELYTITFPLSNSEKISYDIDVPVSTIVTSVNGVKEPTGIYAPTLLQPPLHNFKEIGYHGKFVSIDPEAFFTKKPDLYAYLDQDRSN